MAWSRVLGLLALVVAVAAVPSARRALGRDLLLPAAVLGGLLTAGFALQTEGLQRTTATNAGFITGLYVVLVPLLATLVLRQPLRRDVVLPACLAALGLALLSLQALELHAGDTLVLAAAVLWAGHFLALAHFAPSRNPLALGLAQMAGATLFHTLLALPAGGLQASAAADA